MESRSSDLPSLPARRTFVLQLHADADPATGHFTGRIEHVTSGQATHFTVVEELIAFVSALLRRQESTR